MEAVEEISQDGMWEQANPRAITSDQQYGLMVKSECKDGAVAVTMRNMCKMIGWNVHVHKWFVLDGDNDATWIESMNTVMDDNKVLTLVSPADPGHPDQVHVARDPRHEAREPCGCVLETVCRKLGTRQSPGHRVGKAKLREGLHEHQP